MNSAVIFPGISPSRYSDVAKFMLIDPTARSLVREADDALGYSLLDRYREAAGDYAEPARVAFLVNCLAVARRLADRDGVRPAAVAGPSFGGMAAAVYSGALEVGPAVRMTALWGRRVEEYFAREHRDVVTVSLARLPEDRLDELLAELTEAGEWHDVACFVDRDFTMLSVREGALERVRERVRSLGGLQLDTIRPPMHSEAFRELRDRIEESVFADLRFADPKIPVVSDHDGTLVTGADQVRTLLLDGVVRAVRWPTALRTLHGLGIEQLYVAGPDRLWGRVGCAVGAFQVTTVRPALPRPARRATVA